MSVTSVASQKHAVANALAGRAFDAASYAVNDTQAFEAEFAWRVNRCMELAGLDNGAAVVLA